ncbi:MAG TPA: carbon starvation CstA family protein [candidate division Zixibacteria bacterium]|nr:carbon starvation CstA family protein [candidate division Zixibacteria bacterium]
MMVVNAAMILIAGIIIYFLIYYFRVKSVDKNLMKCDPSRATPAKVYMDGVEYFPTNKFVLFGFQFKSIAGLSPVVGAITAALLWGWLPALIWILVGNIFIGWVQDYFSCMVSIRNEGKSFGPLSYELIGPRTRNILMIFLVFYLILIMAAFASLAAGMLKSSANSIIPTATVLVAGVLVGSLIYKLKMNPFVGTIAGIVFIIAGIYAGAQLPVSIVDVNIWLIALLALCLVAALTPIWSFTQPTIYMFFYVVFFGLVALVASLIFGHPDFVRPDFTGFFAGLTGPAAMPMWPLLFVTIACGSVSGWHSLVSSSATSKQIENEKDVAPVTAGSMLAEGALALLALSIVATLPVVDTKGLAAAAIFTKGASALLGGGTTALAYVGLIFIALALAVMMLVVRLGRLTINEIGGERVPLLKNKYIASILFLGVTFVLASPTFGGTWFYIWVLFGGSNQLMAGLSLMLITLWLLDTKKGWMISGIPGVFMIITTIAALGFASYQSLTKTPAAPGNIVAGIIGIILIIAALIMCYDIYGAFQRRKNAAASK